MKLERILFALMLPLFVACAGKEAEYDASGVFECTEVIVSAKATGELLSLEAEEGQTVAKGERLGVIDTLQLTLRDRQLEASLRATESKRLDESLQVASIRQQISNLQRERTRYEELLKAKAATQKQVDDIDYQIEVLHRQLDAAREQIGSTNTSLGNQGSGIEAQRAQIADNIRNSIVTSPIDGIVLAKYAEPGEFASMGRALLKIADVRLMKLRAYITADQLTKIKIGQKVRVYADSGIDGRNEYAGVVSWISDKAEFTPKTIQTRDERANLVYAIKIEVANDGLIKRGMYGDVKF